MIQNKIATGFTLIEVILALSLTAMLLGLLSTGVFVVSSDWNANSQQLDRSLDEALAILQIDRALHGAFPHSYVDRDANSRFVYFVGESDYLSWVSTVSPQRTPGLMAWELFNEADGVYLSLPPAFSDNPDERLQLADPTLILPGYEASFRFLYEEINLTRQWRDDWLGEEFQSLPLAVYLHLSPTDRSSEAEAFEVVARVANFEHRNLRPNTVGVSF